MLRIGIANVFGLAESPLLPKGTNS